MYGYARTTLFSHAYIDLIFMAIDILDFPKNDTHKQSNNGKYLCIVIQRIWGRQLKVEVLELIVASLSACVSEGYHHQQDWPASTVNCDISEVNEVVMAGCT